MFIRIQHTLDYRYDRPVFLEPALVRLTPRQDCTQRLLEHEIRVTPTPQGQSWSIEQGGSSARSLWFSGLHREFRLETDSLVQTLRDNPFDALVTDAAGGKLPVAYSPETASLLSPYLSQTRDQAIDDWASEIASGTQHQTLAFLHQLTDWIYSNCRMIMREEGEPYSSAQTLSERSGACRDVAILFIEACRSQGIAARFVSGYSIHHPPETIEQELHAWAEVYLPGAGWRGYDPSLGLATADGHIPLTSAPCHQLAAPTSGSFRGTGASATMKYEISLSFAESQQELS